MYWIGKVYNEEDLNVIFKTSVSFINTFSNLILISSELLT